MLAQLIANQQTQMTQLADIAIALTTANSDVPDPKTADGAGTSSCTAPSRLKRTGLPAGPTIVDLASVIDPFQYDPHTGNTFEAWFARYASVFKGQAEHLGESGRIQLLLMKLETRSNKVYRDTIYPKSEDEFSFDDTVKALTGLFDTQESLQKPLQNLGTVR